MRLMLFIGIFISMINCLFSSNTKFLGDDDCDFDRVEMLSLTSSQMSVPCNSEVHVDKATLKGFAQYRSVNEFLNLCIAIKKLGRITGFRTSDQEIRTLALLHAKVTEQNAYFIKTMLNFTATFRNKGFIVKYVSDFIGNDKSLEHWPKDVPYTREFLGNAGIYCNCQFVLHP